MRAPLEAETWHSGEHPPLIFHHAQSIEAKIKLYAANPTGHTGNLHSDVVSHEYQLTQSSLDMTKPWAIREQ